MTLFKLSLRNARRQARDYLVYFVSVVMAAALLYAFNGLVFSQEILNLSRRMAQMPSIIVLASIVVVCIFGWLVSYTTNAVPPEPGIGYLYSYRIGKQASGAVVFS